jgi:hypothetical protein
MNIKTHSISPGIALMFLIVASYGCQENPRGRKAVTGTVKLKGEPLNYGTIEFRSTAGSGVSTGTIIREGKYEIPATKGLPNGTYEVRMNSTEADKSPPEPGSPIMTKNAVERIPAEFNIRTTQKIEVTDNGSMNFDFDIP